MKEEENAGQISDLIKSLENTDDITGVTMEERAKLVLATLGRTKDDIKKAFRKLAKEAHPDRRAGDDEKFKLINEAYALLTKGVIPKRPMLADDALVIRIIGRHIEPLFDKQAEWEKYEKWRRSHFYWDW